MVFDAGALAFNILCQLQKSPGVFEGPILRERLRAQGAGTGSDQERTLSRLGYYTERLRTRQSSASGLDCKDVLGPPAVRLQP
jgi:hypothetical protein